MKRVLLIDDDQPLLEALARTIKRNGYDCEWAATEVEAKARLAEGRYDAIMVDLCMEESTFSLRRRAFCEELKLEGHGATLVGMTGRPLTNQQMFDLGKECLDAYIDKNDLVKGGLLLGVLEPRDKPPARRRFRVAFSYNRSQAHKVSELAHFVAMEVGRRSVLLDAFHLAELARVDADTYLQRLFRYEAELIVVAVSGGYAQSRWCGSEWRAIRSTFGAAGGPDVMPLRFDDAEVPALFGQTDITLDARARSAQELAQLVIERLDKRGQGVPWYRP